MHQPGTCLHIIDGLQRRVTGLDFSPDGTVLVFVDEWSALRGKIRFWHLEAKRDILTFPGSMPFEDVAFSPDGKAVATASSGGNSGGAVAIWSASTGSKLHTLLDDDYFPASCVAFAPDGQTLASGSWNWGAPIRLWDVGSGSDRGALRRANEGIFCLQYSRQTNTLAVGGDQTNEVTLWDTDRREVMRIFPVPISVIYGVALSADGQYLAACGYSSPDVYVWDIKTGSLVRIITGYREGMHAIAFAPSRRELAVRDQRGGISLIDVVTGVVVWESLEATETALSMAFSPDGHHLAVGTWNSVQIFQAA